MDPIKEAFAKAKQDIFNLQSQIESLRRDIQDLKRTLTDCLQANSDKPADKQSDRHTNSTENSQSPAQSPPIQTNQQTNPAYSQVPTDTPAYKQPLEGIKTPFTNASTGNRGVPADRQTNSQTDQQTHQHPAFQANFASNPLFEDKSSHQIKKIDDLERVSQVLDSLDSIKKELRQKFKRLTQQEMSVFSQIYQLEEQGFIVDYSLLSSKLSLTESSIRDYVQKIIKKGIPIQKKKENNKRILLSVLEDLKKIASLETIKALREI